jgi:uridine monophosphate synthetase
VTKEKVKKDKGERVMNTQRMISTKGGQVVAIDLWECGAILDRTKSPEGKGFRLALHEKTPDAPLSPVYVNLRLLQSFPEVMANVVNVYRGLARDLQFDVLAGIPEAATPIAAVWSHLAKVPMITPRQPKSHGLGAKIDGVYKSGQVALAIDDLITGAHSKLDAIAVLKGKSLFVNDVVVLIDREQGGQQELLAAGINLHAAFTLKELLAFYRERELMLEAMFEEIMAYLAAAKGGATSSAVPAEKK